MIRYDEAMLRLRRLAEMRRLGVETIPVTAATSRVLRQQVVAREAWPHFRTSNMDGFAVRAVNTPGQLRLVGEVTAGVAPTVAVRAGEAVRVTTGAAVPDGADAVVRVEDTERDGAHVLTRVRVNAGDSVRAVASDTAPGTVLLEPGRTVAADDVLLLANAGLDEVRVTRRARIAIIATGNELVAAGEPTLSVGQVRNTTTPFLRAALAAHDIVAVHHVRDDRAAFDATLRRVLESTPDIVLTTGAVSMGGEQDFLTHLVREPLFHGVAIRPGKPIACAPLDTHTVWFGLPGNQLSSAVAVEFLLKPFLTWSAGAELVAPSQAHLTTTSSKPLALRCFMRGNVDATGGVVTASVHEAQASYRLQALRDTNAWIVLPEDTDAVPAGTLVEWRAR